MFCYQEINDVCYECTMYWKKSLYLLPYAMKRGWFGISSETSSLINLKERDYEYLQTFYKWNGMEFNLGQMSID